MSAYIKFDGVDGAATDVGHKGWSLIESMSSPVFRSIPGGAKDHQRTRGETTLGDIVVVRELDKASVKLAESCAMGKFFKEVLVDFTSDIEGKNEPYLQYKLTDVIITSYSFHGNGSGSPLPTEEITLNYTEIEWTYNVLDPKTGKKSGNVPGKYSPGANKAG